MRCLSKEEFLTADDLQATEVKLPAAYGEDVGFFVRMMTGTERAEMEKRHFAGNDGKSDPAGFRSAMLIDCIVDTDGDNVFTEEDADVLMGKGTQGIEAMFEAACELNGFSDKDVDTLEKN